MQSGVFSIPPHIDMNVIYGTLRNLRPNLLHFELNLALSNTTVVL